VANIRAFAVPALLVVLGGCVVEQPRERVVVAPPPPARVAVVAEAPPPVVVVQQAPPVEIVEAVPAPRPGFVWAQGFWRWNGNRHVWVKGHWVPERVGYRYVQPRWDQVGGEWHFTAGFWVHV
jgi:hypothetical protein